MDIRQQLLISLTNNGKAIIAANDMEEIMRQFDTTDDDDWEDVRISFYDFWDHLPPRKT